VGAACTTPGGFDLILETDFGNGVSWIRYQLNGTTLFRSVVPKTRETIRRRKLRIRPLMVPFLTNVMNSVPAAAYFQFTCDTPAGPHPCSTEKIMAWQNTIRDVDITLIVMTRQRDMQTSS